MNAFVKGFITGACFTFVVGVVFATLEMHVNKTRLNPIVFSCPDGTKQIIVPDSKKLEL